MEFCQVELLQPERSVKIEPCDKMAEVEVNARSEGYYRVCRSCAKRYFSPKCYVTELAREIDPHRGVYS